MISNADLFAISGPKEFQKIALKVFRLQYQNNPVYQEFCNRIKTNVTQVKSIEQIPFLPIHFFKTHSVLSTVLPVQEIFTSSGTTGAETSKHLVTDCSLYVDSFQKSFSQFYGNIEDYVVLALLPSYLDRNGSSLIYMVQDWILASKNPDSGFYLNNYSQLIETLIRLEKQEQNILLIGVTFALLDLIEKHTFELKHTIVVETGGMKGRRKEMIREELHQRLKNGFGVSVIHSEYGMTELLSQAYSLGDGLFACPPWMHILIRDPEDAQSYLQHTKTGGINVIDLANINSCSFIATQDLGKKYASGLFEVLGRFDHSDIRGCNLMVL